MKRDLRFDLSSVARRLFVAWGAVLLAVLAMESDVLAVTPLPVDIYQDMESGNNNDQLTTTIMNASSHGTQSWNLLVSNDIFWVSTSHASDLRGPVIVGGVTYNGTGGTRSWAYFDNKDNTSCVCTFSAPQALGLTAACFYTPGSTLVSGHYDDTVQFAGSGLFAILETGVDSTGTYLLSHSIQGGVTTRGIPFIRITAGHTYWVNLHWDSWGQCSIAAFDPSNGYAQVGSVSACQGGGPAFNTAGSFGRCDNVGDKVESTISYIDNYMVDYTNGIFPLIPGATDTTAPSAPPVVRDGLGTDISTTSSRVTLSANWDAGSDAESGIFGYRYAIGSTPGGTDVMNWIYLGNVTSVTRTRLAALTVGQTYYFSVKSVNGAGLLSAATISNGQTIVTDPTPPSAPPTVSNTAFGPLPAITTTTSTTELCACWDPSTDNESGISGYQYGIGTTPGGTQTVNWTSVINTTTAACFNLSLTVGQTYYYTVRAVNGALMTGSATNSAGVLVVDTTPPSAPPAVRDGTGTDIATTTSTTQLSANWDAATDAQSGISGYQYAIGTTAGGTQTVNWTSLGNVTTVTKTSLALTVGQTYYFSVKAVNGSGLTGAATNSDGQTVVSSSTTYFSDNFESWAVHGGAWSSVNGESATHTLNTSTDQARAGTKSLKITDTDTTSTTGVYLTKTFSPTLTGNVYARFYMYLPIGWSSTMGTSTVRLLYLTYGSYNAQLYLSGTGSKSIKITSSKGWPTTTAVALSEGQWYCIEMHVAPPSATTSLDWWVDGTQYGSETVDFSSLTCGSIQLGELQTGATGMGTLYMDELVVSDTYIDPLP